MPPDKGVLVFVEGVVQRLIHDMCIKTRFCVTHAKLDFSKGGGGVLSRSFK